MTTDDKIKILAAGILELASKTTSVAYEACEDGHSHDNGVDLTYGFDLTQIAGETQNDK